MVPPRSGQFWCACWRHWEPACFSAPSRMVACSGSVMQISLPMATVSSMICAT
jgi:hypothetical protein